jgi:hypothetical protein
MAEVTPLPHTSSWYSADITKHKDNLPFFTFTIYMKYGLSTLSENRELRRMFGIARDTKYKELYSEELRTFSSTLHIRRIK